MLIDFLSVIEMYLDHQASSHSRARAASTGPTAEDVLLDLDFDPDLLPSDVDQLLQLGTPAMQHMTQTSRIDAIQASPRLRAWTYVDQPALLAVQGNASSAGDASTSFVAAKLARSLLLLQHRPPDRGQGPGLEVIPLAHFCGQHANPYRDAAARPGALARGLLLQLLARHRGFHPADLQRCWDAVRGGGGGGIGATLVALARMVERLPSRSMVFLVVDEVEAFQTPPERGAGLRDVLVRLVEMFRRREGGLGAKMKILFTTSTRSRFLEELLRDEEIVNIPNDPPPGGSWNHIISTSLIG